MRRARVTFRRRIVLAGLVLSLSALVWTACCETAAGQTTAEVVRVEEDWELVVGTPDANSAAPQLSCVISPVGNTESVHAAFEVNHQSMPDFVPGGLQLQIWNGEEPLASRKFPNGTVMQQQGETVQWTQSVSLEGGVLTFEILNGSSTSWGAFGGQGYLKAAVTSSLENLNGYSPSVSVANSGVSYAANRVESLTLRRVRLVKSDGEVLEVEPQYVVYPKQ